MMDVRQNNTHCAAADDNMLRVLPKRSADSAMCSVNGTFGAYDYTVRAPSFQSRLLADTMQWYIVRSSSRSWYATISADLGFALSALLCNNPNSKYEKKESCLLIDLLSTCVNVRNITFHHIHETNNDPACRVSDKQFREVIVLDQWVGRT